MQQYNVLQALYLSFYSKKLYRDVAQNWGGKAFFYLLLLIALTTIVSIIKFATQHQSFKNYASELVMQIPDMSIKNGKVNTPENRPYIIVKPGTNETFVMIDTSGKNKSLKQSNTKILITESHVIAQNDAQSDEISIYKIPDDVNVHLTQENAKSYLDSFFSYAWLFFFIAISLISYFYRIIQALIYGIIGKIFSVINHVPLSYAQVIQISMVAITPVMILTCVLNYFNISFIFQWLLYFILAMIYLFYGILANKSQPNKRY